jgi:hypothetical protein
VINLVSRGKQKKCGLRTGDVGSLSLIEINGFKNIITNFLFIIGLTIAKY